MSDHHSIVPFGMTDPVHESVTALLADGSVADSLRPYMNDAIAELVASVRQSPDEDPLSAAGQGGRLTPVPPASVTEDRDTGASPGPILSEPAMSGSGAGVPTEWTPADLARLSSLVVATTEAVSPGSPGPVPSLSEAMPGLAMWGRAQGVSADASARGEALAELSLRVPPPGEGLAGLFDAPASGPSAPSGAAYPSGRSLDDFTGADFEIDLPADSRLEVRPMPREAGGSTSTEAEMIAELVSRLVMAVERLEQVAGRQSPPGPRPIRSTPRPFLGRVDA